MATSTILQNHSSAMTVFTLPGQTTYEVTLSGGGSRGVIIVGANNDGYVPSIHGFRFSSGGTTWNTEWTAGAQAELHKSATNKFTITNLSTHSVSIVIFMSEKAVSSIANVTPS